MAHILVAEDDPAICNLIATVLRKNGHTVDVVTDGAQAIERMQSNHYDSMVLDLMMPRVSGFDVLKYLKDHDVDRQCVVVATAAGRSLTHVLESDESVYCVLEKPFDINSLLKAIASCIEGIRLETSFIHAAGEVKRHGE